MKDVIAIFDIGKTNKKFFLFDAGLKPVYQIEQNFAEIIDESGFVCDDIESICKWMIDTVDSFKNSLKYNIKTINFSTYGASLVYLDSSGKRLTPVYNYLKTMPEGITEQLYSRYGGVGEFSRQTASPALGFLNSGLQILWLKKSRPEIFAKVTDFLHLPQFFSFLFSGERISEFTSIGCHTALWNFDKMNYHSWLKDENIRLPKPVSNSITYKPTDPDFSFSVGTGIHDSSASLAPYILQCKEKFILLSTGTWCISMNPFNHEPLTAEQLKNDCLAYMSISQKPVKSSRLFMGKIHDVNVERITEFFKASKNAFKNVRLNNRIIKNLSASKDCFFQNEIGADYIDRDVDFSKFENFEEAYHCLILGLTRLTVKSVKLILPEKNDISSIFISGGFARNEIFVNILANSFPDKHVYTSEFDNSSALGAALVVYKDLKQGIQPEVDLGLKEWIATKN